jgi:hypothetical protein
MSVSRRSFLSAAPAAALLVPSIVSARSTQAAPAVSSTFPTHEPDLVRDFVGASHGRVARVRELLAKQPALANAAWDWGWGDWETALGAASHVGNVECAELLLAAGARPSIFSAAMLGQLDVVKAFIAASPGIQRTRGPHGLTLLHHAEAGEARAAAVTAYLKALGDADIDEPSEPLAAADRDAIVGVYAFGTGPRDRFTLSLHERFGPQLTREGASARPLIHLGRRVFHPKGTPAVRVTFAAGTPAPAMSIVDGDIALAATRV